MELHNDNNIHSRLSKISAYEWVVVLGNGFYLTTTCMNTWSVELV